MSVKRVFAIIGIVLGAITAFVGAVLGVMAAMGKFKTPVVKPEKIYFENAEQVIVAQYTDDLGKDVIYSFTLVGTNKSIDHEVNVKDCFIWFENGVGEDLIELCDEKGNLLDADAKKRYKIKCNEKVYYKLKVVDETVTPDPTNDVNGKVVLKARTADELHNAEEDLVIWIDRSIKNIFLDYGKIPDATNNKIQEQRINIGKDSAVEFDYVVNPEISMQPISKESKKVVELYYDDPKTEDFVLVNLENIKNKELYSLYKIFDETKCSVDPTTGELKLTFLSSEVTNGSAHYFKLAIFDSYNARAEFMADESNLTLTNVKRLESMVVTDLYIEVVNTSIDKVEVSSGVLNLSLYTDDNVVYLNYENAERNDLNVEMYSGDIPLDVRLNEVDFKGMAPQRFNGYPKFVLERTVVGVVNEIDFADYDIVSYSETETELRIAHKETNEGLTLEVQTSIKVGDYLVINALRNANGNFYCVNGIAMVEPSAEEIKLLNVGSYLDFYIFDEDTQTYTFATETDIKYTVESKVLEDKDLTNGDSNKYWNVVIKSISSELLDGSKILVLGLLVANNDGKFDVENMFATKVVSVAEEELSYSVKNSVADLELIANGTGYNPNAANSDIDFDDFIEVTGGTYNACVLVIPETEIFEGVDPDKKDISIVEYINVYYEKNGTKYYVVGYFDNNGKFVNKVTTKDNPNITKDTENKLKLLQLVNGFNSTENRQETASEFINKLINGKDISTEHLEIKEDNVKSLINETIYINQVLLVDDESVVFNVDVDSKTGMYAGTNDHALQVSANNDTLMARLVNFYNISLASVGNNVAEGGIYIVNNYLHNANIDAVEIDEGKLIIGFDLGEMLNNSENIEIGLANVFVGEKVLEELCSFKILSSAPEEIRFYYGAEDKFVTLTKDSEDPRIPVVTAKLTWDSTNKAYVTEWFIGETSLGNSFGLNSELSKLGEGVDAYSGFKDPSYKVSHKITYGVFGNSVAVIDDPAGSKHLEVLANNEDSYLSVLIYNQVRYLKVSIDASAFKMQQISNVLTGETTSLKDVVSYKHVDEDIYSGAVEKGYLTLTNFSVQYANDNSGTIEILSEANQIKIKYNYVDESLTDLTLLTIDKKENPAGSGLYDWVFTRSDDKYSALNVMLDVVTKTNTLKNITIKFEQDVTRELNAISWGVTPKLYQGTTIQLYEIVKNNNEFTTEPLIKIRNKGNNTVTVTTSKGTVNPTGTIELSDLGMYDFTIKIGSVEIGSYSIEVVPNLVVKQNTAEDLVLRSNSTNLEVFDKSTKPEDVKKGYVKLYQYQTTGVVYGTKVGDKFVLYSTEDMLVDKTADDGITTSVTFESEGDIILKSGTTVSTGWINKIGEQKTVVVTVKSDGIKVGTFTAIVENQYIVKTDNINIANNTLNIKAMVDISQLFTVDGLSDEFALNSIKWKYSDADNNDDSEIYVIDSEGKLIIPAMSNKHENVTLILVFKEIDVYGNVVANGRELNFEGKNVNGLEDLVINVTPFELVESGNISQAFSETDFNVLNHVYDVASVKMSDYFEYIKVLSVEDKDGNPLTVNGVDDLGFAYVSNNDDGLVVKFKNISGDEISAFIEYEVKYKNLNDTYKYKKEITLKNWQDLTVETPEQSEELTYDSQEMEEIVLINYVSGQEETFNSINYEPILVNVEKPWSINLLNDEFKHVRRFSAIDRRKTVDNSSSISIKNLTVLAYQNNLGLDSYAARVESLIDVKKGIITFPETSALSGLIAFRLVSESGNYDDYFVYVTSLGDKTEVFGDVKDYVNSNESKTISDYVSETDLQSKFKIEYKSQLEMFLLDARTLTDKADNKGFNSSIVKETTIGTGDDQVVYSGKRYTEVKNCTLNIEDFTTITLSLIYNDGYNFYPVGILTLYLRPNGAPITIPGDTDNIIHNGEFECEIDANDPTHDFPSADFSVHKIIQSGSVVGVEGTKLKLEQKVTESYTFVVFYKHISGYIIKVTYNYKAVDIKDGEYIPVGKLVSGATDTETKFNNIVTIDSTYYRNHFGNYYGEIQLGEYKDGSIMGGATFTIDSSYKFSGAASGNIMTGVTYTLTSGVLTLTFEQGLYDQVKNIGIEYSKLNDQDKKVQVYTFDVESGLHIETNSTADSGVSDSQRMATTLKDNYTNADGSYIEITKTTTGDGVKYVIGGYTIYVNNTSGNLEFVFNVETSKYVIGEDVNKVIKTNSLTFDATSGKAIINFIHLPKEKNINVTFNILRGNDYFKTDATTELNKTLYLTVSQTYLQVEATYVTVENNITDAAGNRITYKPTMENVVKGTEIKELTENYLFVKSIYAEDVLENNCKLKLKKYDESYIYADFSGMGFKDTNNLNYLNIDQITGYASSINGGKGVKFSSDVAKNEIAKVYLTNMSEMPTCIYTFQVMADDKVDGITFSQAGYVDESANYMSFVINDDDSSDTYNTGKLLIGTIKDESSSGIWVQTLNHASSWKYLPKSGDEDDRMAENFNKPYDIILDVDPYDNTNYNIYLEYHRRTAGSVMANTTIIQPKIHGTSGYILDGSFKIVLINAKVGPKDENIETGIYGGEQIDLTTKLDLPANTTLSVDWNKSTYGESGSSVNNVLKESSDLVTDVNTTSGKPTIDTKTVGKPVIINLVLNTQIDGYYVKDITYSFQLERSLQFFFNGDGQASDLKPEPNTEYYTNFVMTNKTTATSSATNFDLTFSFGSVLAADGSDKVASGDTTYYSSLLWEIKNCLTSANTTAKISKNPSKYNPDVVDGTDNKTIFEVTQAGITFKKDYTGEINLLLTVELTNGFNYSVNWKIMVYGILNITESIKTDDGYLPTSTSYNSGDKVDLLNDYAGGSTGLYLQDMKDYFENYIDYSNVKMNVKYSIVKHNPADEKTNAERFGDGAAETVLSNSGEAVDKKYQTNLPIVPSILPSSSDRYLVIYKVDLTYCGKTYTYYVAYRVVNILNISVVNETIDIDGDDSTTTDIVKLKGNNINVNTRLDSKNLDLFYYTETYKEGSNTYKITLEGANSYKVSVNNAAAVTVTNIQPDSNDINKLTISYGSETKPVTKYSSESYYKPASGNNIPIYSVFSLSFNNIIEFNNFIKSIHSTNSVIIDSVTKGENTFKLIHIANGRWGIDLSENSKFFSNKLEDADLVIKATNGETIYTLSKYNEKTDTGFRLYTTNSLSAKGSRKLRDLFLSSNVSDYTTFKDYDIIGVYGNSGVTAPQTNWVSGTNVSFNRIVDDNIATIEVPTDKSGGYITYTLQQVEYSGADSDGVPGVCDIKQKFYVIKAGSGGAAVYKANYDSVVVQSFKENEDTIVDLTGLFKKFANDSTSGALVETNVPTTGCTALSDTYGVNASYSSGKLTVLNSTLRGLRLADDSRRNVPASYKVTLSDGVTLYCEFTFGLYPSNS